MKITHGNTYSVNSVREKITALHVCASENVTITITLDMFGVQVELSGEEWNHILDLAVIGLNGRAEKAAQVNKHESL